MWGLPWLPYDVQGAESEFVLRRRFVLWTKLLFLLRLLVLILLHGHCFNRSLGLLVEVSDAVLERNAKLLQLDEPLLGRVDIVPHFGDVFTRQRDPHALNSGDKIGLSDLALPTLVHKSEHISNVAVFLFHTTKDEGEKLLDVLDLHRTSGV